MKSNLEPMTDTGEWRSWNAGGLPRKKIQQIGTFSWRLFTGFSCGVLHRRVDTLEDSAKNAISSSVKDKNDDLVKKLEGRMQTLDSKLEHMANFPNAQAEVSTQKLNAALSAFSSAQGAFEDKYNALLDRFGAVQVRLDVLEKKVSDDEAKYQASREQMAYGVGREYVNILIFLRRNSPRKYREFNRRFFEIVLVNPCM